MEINRLEHKLTAILPHNYVPRPQWVFNLPILLPEPKRRRLSVPPSSQCAAHERLNLLQQIADGKKDVGDLSHVT